MEGSVRFGRSRCRAMSRCECTGATFDEIARRVRQGRPLEAVQLETGAGLLCTACVPDLREHVAAAAEADEAAVDEAAVDEAEAAARAEAIGEPASPAGASVDPAA